MIVRFLLRAPREGGDPGFKKDHFTLQNVIII